MNKPKKVFDSSEELQEYVDYWVEKLFLTDWIIKAELVPTSRIEGSYGKNINNWMLKTSHIQISVYDNDMREILIKSKNVRKFCQEQTLIHELLHSKYCISMGKIDKYELLLMELTEHAKLEQLAKSLLMTKYDLTFDWFKDEWEED